MKRFVFAFIAAFIFIFLWGWFYNGILLKDVFAEAQSLFRPREEMMGLFHWIIIGQAGLALVFRHDLRQRFRRRRNRGGRSARNHVGDFGGQCALRDLRDATISGKASGADKHRRLHRNDRYRRNRWRNLQISGCANRLRRNPAAVALQRRVRRRIFAHVLTDSRCSRLPHAGGMGTARRDLAFMATARRDQFSGFLRSRDADLARNGRRP